MRRILIVAKGELRFALAGPLPWATLLLAMLLGVSLNLTTFTAASESFGETLAERPFVNSQHALAWMLAMSGFVLYGSFAALLAGWARLRDEEHRMDDLLHSTPLTAGEYLAGKALGVLGAVGTVASLQVAAAVLWLQLGPLDAESSRGPFSLGAYLRPALLFLAPAAALSATSALLVAERSRKPLAVLAVPIGWFFAVFFLISWTPPDLPRALDAALMTLDPSGLRWLLGTVFGVDRGVAFYNHRPLPVDAVFVANRLLVSWGAVLALWWAIRERRRRPRKASVPEDGAVTPPPVLPFADLGPLRMTAEPPPPSRAALLVGRAELRELLGQPALFALLVLLLLLVWDVSTSVSGPLGAPTILDSGTLAVATHGILTAFLLLVLLVTQVEALARETTAGIAPIVDSTPISTGGLLGGKGLANLGLVALVLVATAGGTALIQLGDPLAHWQPGPFAIVWLLLLGPTLVLWTSFVAAVQAWSRHRPTTYSVGLVALAATALHLRSGSLSWQLDWTLLGALRWSDLGAFELDRRALVINRLTVLAGAWLLAVLARRGFRRTEPDGARAALRAHRGRLRSMASIVPHALPALAGLVVLGVMIHQGPGGQPAADRRVEYRRANLATWSDAPAPTVVHRDLRVELMPKRGAAEVRGIYRLVNRTRRPLVLLPFTAPEAAAEIAWSIAGRAAGADDRHGLHAVSPPTPMAQGSVLELGFSYEARYPPGTTRRGAPPSQFVLPSGTHLHTLRDSFLPEPGFDSRRGDPLALAPARRIADFWTEDLPPAIGPRMGYTTRITVIAPRGTSATSVGDRLLEVEEPDGKTRSEWRSDVPVRALNITAGPWRIQRAPGAEVHHHPAHEANARAMALALSDARALYSTVFGPYPWGDLRIVELPRLFGNAQGFPTNMPFAEGFGFRTNRALAPLAPDLLVGHEAAHQWWGNLLAPADGPGTGHLAEGMAHYAALLLREHRWGAEARRELSREMERSYLQLRRSGRERPLLAMLEEEHPADWTVVYEKGALVMWMLQQELGRDRLHAALRSFIQRHRAATDHPATQDLLEFLRERAADVPAYDRFVAQWFEDIVLPELRVTHAERQRHAGGWRVLAEVGNVGTGRVVVEVAVEGERTPEGSHGPRELVRIDLGGGERRAVHWSTEFEPFRVVVDPGIHLLLRNRAAAGATLTP